MDGKICQNKTPYSHTHSPLITTKHLGKIRRLGYIWCLHFLLYVNSLKKFFKQKYVSKNIKIQKVTFEVGFSYKDCI